MTEPKPFSKRWRIQNLKRVSKDLLFTISASTPSFTLIDGDTRCHINHDMDGDLQKAYDLVLEAQRLAEAYIKADKRKDGVSVKGSLKAYEKGWRP